MQPNVLRAVLLSFLVYLVPIIGPHAFLVLGWLLAIDIGALGTSKELLWIVSDVGFALVLQLIIALTFIWIGSGRKWRWLTLVLVVPSSIWIVNYACMITIPSLFLIEKDTAAEQRRWEPACTIDDARLATLRSGVQLELSRSGSAWLTFDKDGRYGVLSMPGCQWEDAGLDRTTTDAISSVTDQAAVYYTIDKKTGAQRHWFKSNTDAQAQELQPPSSDWWMPVLSRGADAIAWLDSERSPNGSGFSYRIVIRMLADGSIQSTVLPAEIRQPELLSVDLQAREILLSSNFNEFLAVDLNGVVKWGPDNAGPVEYVTTNYRRLDDGWLSWDSYREEGRNRIFWTLPLGQGTHEVLKGRHINDVAVDPRGRYIAVSVTTALNIGSIRDAVYVIRTADGSEAYRRYLDRYTRSQVAFVGADFFALNVYESDGEAVSGRVVVLQVP